MTRDQEHNARVRSRGPRAAAGEDAHARSEQLRDALLAPLRWLRDKAASASRWLRRRLRFRPSSIIDALRRWSKGRGFGFWWLVVTLLLAGVVGLLVAAILTPVMGILACLAVAIWLLIRKSTGNSRGESGDDHDRERGDDRGSVGSAATA